jgi:dTDP-4-dehydrorhamnose 3,5-epimerase-like enzyme
MGKSKFKLITNVLLPSEQANLQGLISVFNVSLITGFYVKRVYVISGEKKGSIRGHHAHKELKQIMFCNYGSIKIQLFDGLNWSDVILNQPNRFLFVEAMVWRTMEWMEDNSVLTVLASEEYDESDYIRDLIDFNRMAKDK